MASAYRRGGRWYVRYRDSYGRDRRETCKANGRTEALRLAWDLERRAERQRLGLEPRQPLDGGGTVAELLKWWLKEYVAGTASERSVAPAVRRHLLGTELAGMLLADVSPGDIERLLQSKVHPTDGKKPLGPQTLNHLRMHVLSAFRHAIEAGRWNGTNPAATVRKRSVPRRGYDTLRAAEVAPMLAALPAERQPLFATAIYTGLRKGELFALRKRDVDLVARRLTVARSHGRDTTKGQRADVIPIAEPLVPYLRVAIRASSSELVFPAADGERQREDTDLADVLRRALARAGLVIGYEHRCRRHGCGHREPAPDAALRRCPEDNRKLWPVALPRPLRFHDLRHTTATLLLEAGVSLAVVQKVMRHSDPKLTTETYGHLADKHIGAELDRGFAALMPTTAPIIANEAARALAGVSLGTISAQTTPEAPQSTNDEETKRQSFRQFDLERATRFELATLSLGRTSPGGAQSDSASQGLVSIASGSAAASKPTPAITPIQGQRGTNPASRSEPAAAALSVIEGGARDLLTVREVARRLGVSTATVYKLCDNQELEHVRVRNAIRVSPVALAAYLEARTRR